MSETVFKMLQAIFNSKIGSLELNIDKDGFNRPQLVISSYLSKEVNDKWNSLKQMYTVEQLDEYNKLRKLVYLIIDDYYALEDEKIISKYNEREDWDLVWEEDEDVEF